MNLATEAGKGTDFTSTKLKLSIKQIALNWENGISGNINLINRTQNGQFYGVIH